MVEAQHDEPLARRVRVRCWARGQPDRVITGYATGLCERSAVISTNRPFKPDTRIQIELIGDRGGFLAEGLVESAKAVPRDLQKIRSGTMDVRFLSLAELIRENVPAQRTAGESPTPPSSDSISTSAVAALVAKQEEEGTSRRTDGAKKHRSSERRRDPESGSLSQPPRESAKSSPAPESSPSVSPTLSTSGLPQYRVRYPSRKDFLREFERNLRWGNLFIKTDTPATAPDRIEVVLEVPEEPEVRFPAEVVRRVSGVPGAARVVAGLGVRLLEPEILVRISALAYGRR